MKPRVIHCVAMRNIIVMVLLTAMCVMPVSLFAGETNSKKNLVLQGSILKVLIDGRYKELKRGDFYGYGWLDDHRVFVAYQQEGYSEAIVNAEVVDLRHSRVFNLGTIMEAHGESNFDVNPSTGEVVFSGTGEDKIAVNDNKVGPYGISDSVVMLMMFDEKTDSYQVSTIKNRIDCINVFWIDNNTIGATLNDGRSTFVKISIPRDQLKLSARKIYGVRKLAGSVSR